MRCRAVSNTSHTYRLIHPHIVKRNTVVRSKHVGPLHVRYTVQGGKRMMRRWRSLATPLPVGDEMELERLFGRNHSGRRPLHALVKRWRPAEDSLQGKEGVLCPFSLLVGATSSLGRVSRVISTGRWQRVGRLRSLLQELIELWRTQIDLSHKASWGFVSVIVWVSTMVKIRARLIRDFGRRWWHR